MHARSLPDLGRRVDGPPTHSTRRPAPPARVDHALVAGARVPAAALHRFGVSDHWAVSADLC